MNCELNRPKNLTLNKGEKKEQNMWTIDHKNENADCIRRKKERYLRQT
jgi:hypothetical protein